MTESVPKLLAYILGLYFVYIPLLWGWVRCALTLLDKIQNNSLQYPDMWSKVLNTIPGITVGMLVGVSLCSISCVRKQIESFYLWLLCSGLIFILMLLVIYAIWRIWSLINDELLTISDRRGS